MITTEARPEQSVSGKSAAPLSVRVDAVKPYVKNTMLSFVDFTLLGVGLSIKGASIHEKDGKRLVSLPSRSYSDREGPHWAPIIEFASKEARGLITDRVLAAFEEYSAGGNR